jgi:pyridoxine/pyridoxamine 5'-phosphate oxidase
MNKSEILSFLRAHRLAVQATASLDGAPQAAVVGYAVTDNFEIVFDTLASTRKAQNIRRNPKLAFVIGGLKKADERTVQYEGIADEPVGEELEQPKQIYYAVFPDGPSRSSWLGLIYVRVKPTWLRYSDYNSDPPEIVELNARELTG